MKNKMAVISLLMLAFTIQDSYSQKLPIKLGLKVAPNIGWMNSDAKGYENDGISGGVTVGFVTEFYFMQHYAVSTGFNFSFLNGKLSYPFMSIQASDTLSGTMKRKYEFTYFEIPVILKMKTKEYGKFSFYAQIGFGTGFRLKAKAVDEFQPVDQESISDKSDITNKTTLMREAIIIGAGTEYHIDESTVILLGINYSNSLNNVLTGTNTVNKDVSDKGILNFAELSIGVLF